VKVEDVWEAARSVRDSPGVPLLVFAFGSLMVEEASDSVTRQVSFRKSARWNVRMPLLLGQMSVSVYSLFPHCSLEVV
jgi:hypothetical protein